jgi:ribosome biogenesis GTPase A
MSYWPVTKRVVKDADIVLLVVDARMPELSYNEELERIVKYHGKKMVIVFNKVDLISQRGLNELREKYPEAFFVSGTVNMGMKRLKEGLYIMARRMGIEEPKIGVVGYPNVGKSAVINALAKRARARVSSIAGTTKGIQWVRVGELRILDSPGVVPMDDKSVKLGLIGAKDPEKMKLPEKPAYEIIKFLKGDGKLKLLENAYRIDLGGRDVEGILIEIGKRKGFLKKGGEVDERKTAIQFLRDWNKGKVKYNI